jgi:hypothetical protein
MESEMAIHPDEEMLSEWMDGEALPEDALMLRSHLKTCEYCRERMRSLLDVGEAMAPLRAVTPPPSLKRNFLREWESRWGQLNARRIVGSLTLAGAPALAGGILLALLAPQLAFRPEPPALAPERNPMPGIRANPAKDKKATVGADPRIAMIFMPASPVRFKGLGGEDATEPNESRPLPPHPSKRAAVRPNRARLASLHVNRASERHRQKADSTPAPLETALASAKANESESIKPVFKLTVEEDPNYEPPLPKRTICSWSAKNEETGDLDQGSIIRHFDPDGDLKSVELDLSLGDATRLDSSPAGGETRPIDAASPAPAIRADSRASHSDSLDEAKPLNSKESENETVDDRIYGPRSLCMDLDGSGDPRLPSI